MAAWLINHMVPAAFLPPCFILHARVSRSHQTADWLQVLSPRHCVPTSHMSFSYEELGENLLEEPPTVTTDKEKT